MIRTLSLTKARSALGKISQSVAFTNDIVFLERDGIPEVALVGIDMLEDMLENNQITRDAIQESFKEYQSGKGRSARAFLASLE